MDMMGAPGGLLISSSTPIKSIQSSFPRYMIISSNNMKAHSNSQIVLLYPVLALIGKELPHSPQLLWSLAGESPLHGI